jgi:hypothetical protein
MWLYRSLICIQWQLNPNEVLKTRGGGGKLAPEGWATKQGLVHIGDPGGAPCQKKAKSMIETEHPSSN